jgi:hypothetical protein
MGDYKICEKCLWCNQIPYCVYKGFCKPENDYEHLTPYLIFNGVVCEHSNPEQARKEILDSFKETQTEIKDDTQPLGLRFNEGKRKWSLVDFDSLEDMVKVLEFGAKKYGEYNWQKGLKTTDIIESMLRHVFSYLNGEDNDKESGISHIGHIQCNAMFLAYMQKNKPELDSRRLKTINQNNFSCNNSMSCNDNNINSNTINQSNESIQKNEIDKEQRKELNKE